jgi:hypothetical protein
VGRQIREQTHCCIWLFGNQGAPLAQFLAQT